MEENFNQAGDAGAMGGMMMLFLFGVYFYFAFAQFKIAQKLNHDNAWFAFIPILNIVQLVQLAGKPMIWFLGMLVPVVNLVMYAMIWIEIAKKAGHSSLVGFLSIIPPISFITVGMIAWGRGSASSQSAPMSPPQQPAPREPQNVG